MKKKEIFKKLTSMSDKDKWKFLIENQNLGLVVKLDNDDTYITNRDGKLVCSFYNYIGDSDGVFFLLEALGIKHEGV